MILYNVTVVKNNARQYDIGCIGQCVDGNQRIMCISELISDDEDLSVGASGEGEISENCSFSSLDDALTNLTSNVLINITTDITLS